METAWLISSGNWTDHDQSQSDQWFVCICMELLDHMPGNYRNLEEHYQMLIRPGEYYNKVNHEVWDQSPEKFVQKPQQCDTWMDKPISMSSPTPLLVTILLIQLPIFSFRELVFWKWQLRKAKKIFLGYMVLLNCYFFYFTSLGIHYKFVTVRPWMHKN